MLKNIFWTKEKYGRVHVKYGKPISLNEKLAEFIARKQVDEKTYFSRANVGLSRDQISLVKGLKKDFAKEMSLDIVYTLSENLVIMSTQMVASMLLLKR